MSDEPTSLCGKVAVVTGAGRGIGRAEALALAAAGATVVVNDVGDAGDGTGHYPGPAEDVVGEITRAGGTAVADYADVSRWDEGTGLIDRTVDRFGRLDALVCNAGIIRDRMLFNLDEPAWDDVIRVNLKGRFVPLRAAAIHWRASSKAGDPDRKGAIVLTASSSGLYGNPGQSNYVVAKAGNAALVLTAARELAAYGVRVNGISPSARTRLTEQTFAVDPRTDAVPSTFDALDPDNVAPLVAYLCSDASQRITGQMFTVRGGLIQLIDGWRPKRAMATDAPWTVGEIARRLPELVDVHDHPPAMPEEMQP